MNVEYDYKPNSHKSKQENELAEKKKVEKVVRGNVKTKKKKSLLFFFF